MKILTTILLLAMAASSQAQKTLNPEQVFYRGREFFDQGDFDEAVEAYKSAVDVGASKELLYNLGTACLYAGRNGEALYYLRRAEKLAPRDVEIQNNIRVAQARAQDDVQESRQPKFVQALLYFHTKTTFNEALLAFVLCYGFSMLFLHLRLLRPGKWFLRLAVVLIIFCLGMGYSIVTRAWSYDEVTKGVILPPEVDVFSQRISQRFALFFKLHGATEVDVVDVKDGWVQIEVDGKKGFVLADQIGLI